MDMLFVTT